MALLVTVAAVDTGVVPYVVSLSNNWFNTSLDSGSHTTILLLTLALLAVQTTLNIIGAKVMGRVAGFGTYAEVLGTFGIALILLIAGFHHGLGFLFSDQGVQHAASNPLGLDFHGNWITGAALIAVLAPVYIFYGFESAGDISEETKDAGRQVPRAMRLALIWGGIASLILTAALLLAMPAHNAVGATVKGGGVPFILGQLSSGMQDFLLVLIIFAFFSCGTSIQGAGSRLMFSYSRDEALPASSWLSRVHPRFGTPVNALIAGAVVSTLFVLLVFASPSTDKHFLFITYPGGLNALYALVSFGVSGIYLSFLLTVIGALIARTRGWVPEGRFTLGSKGMVVTVVAAAYLALMFINVVLPSGLTSPRAVFNYDWITLLVMFVIAVVGAAYFFTARPDRGVRHHLHDDLEPTGAERELPPEDPPVATV
jgi:amino acid transporter